MTPTIFTITPEVSFDLAPPRASPGLAGRKEKTLVAEDREIPVLAGGGTSLARSSGLILLLSVLTLALAFGVQVVLAARLGTSREMDSYLVAITLPALGAIVAHIAFTSALVPILRGRLRSGETGQAEKVLRAAWGVSLGVGVALAIGISVTARALVRLTAPGLDPVASQTAGGLLSVTALALAFDLPRGVLTARQYALDRYLAPQIAPSLNHAILLFSAIVLLPRWGLGAMAGAWTVGSAAMLGLLLRSAVRTRAPAAGTSPEWQSLGALPAAVAVAVFSQATPFVDRWIASTLPEGAISALGYGSKILDSMMRTIPMAIVLALFPLLSQHAARHEWPEYRVALGRGLRWVLVGSVPLLGSVVLLRQEWITLLFQRGQFDRSSSIQVAESMLWYGMAFLPLCLAYLGQHAHYALDDTRFLARLGLGLLMGTAALDILLSRAMGLSGIAAASLAVSTGAAAILFSRLARRRLAPKRSEIGPSFVRALAAAMPMTAVLVVIQHSLSGSAPSPARLAIGLLAGSTAAAAVYVSILALLKAPEWVEARLLWSEWRARFL